MPAAGATVQFISETDRSINASAIVGPDGTYSLSIRRDGLQAEGAAAGANLVILTPPGSLPKIFPAPYRVEPRDNQIDLTIDGPVGPGRSN